MGRHQSNSIALTDEERKLLNESSKTKKWSPREALRAKILLLADQNAPISFMDREIAEKLECSISTVEKRRKRFSETRCIEDALFDKQRTGRPTIVDGLIDAHITTIACSAAPEGYSRWTLKLIHGRLVQLEICEKISVSTVERFLEKKKIKPWLNEEWKIPSKNNAEFVCQMERIIGIYCKPYNPKHPVVCVDESNKQHLKDLQEPLPVRPGDSRKFNSEYERNGISNMFMFFEPLGSLRQVSVTDQRTAIDFAHAMKYLADDLYPFADIITVVLDNLNTHTKASLYKAFEPQEAKRIADRLNFEYTPKHGSWLNMAESEFSVLSRQCLDRRISDQGTLKKEIDAWVEERNRKTVVTNWQFTVEDARIKLKNLYPEIKNTRKN